MAVVNVACAKHGDAFLNEHGGCVSCIDAGAGAKSDDGKPDYTFLFDLWDGLTEVVRVLEFGAKKYKRGNYLLVDDARRRYSRAAINHLSAWYNGEQLDNGPGGSGRNHLACAVCSALFLLVMDLRGSFQKKGD
jgi:hypothetical protein